MIGIEAAVLAMNRPNFLVMTATSMAPAAGPPKTTTGHEEAVAMVTHNLSIGCPVEVAVVIFTEEGTDQVEATSTEEADLEAMECILPMRSMQTIDDMGTDEVDPMIQTCARMVDPCPRRPIDMDSPIPIEVQGWRQQRVE